ncbi:hypothetical protein CEXT_134921 [Caerostris extrusa]|uniref:Uncharacterized protein n=1 Tax=Caerostris extrusa TaxID=172846 RepID=A0AAV4Q5W0_CAEEX|nr:hypothetical protein CEXT_134921 [Caerostris extrusa]
MFQLLKETEMRELVTHDLFIRVTGKIWHQRVDPSLLSPPPNRDELFPLLHESTRVSHKRRQPTGGQNYVNEEGIIR